jgi:serine protease Do
MFSGFVSRFGKSAVSSVWPAIAALVIATLASAASAQEAKPPAAAEASPKPPAAAEASPETAADVGPRSLSVAFRDAAAMTTPCVVTVFSYGQFRARDLELDEEEGLEELEKKLNPLAPGLDGPNEPAEEAPDGEPAPGEVGPVAPPQTDDQGEKLPVTGLGSGVIISADGLIITNHHVVANATRVVVQTYDQTELEVVKISSDPKSDLAVLKVNSREPLAAAAIGDSDKLDIGDWVLAIGSPFELEATVSAGIISAKNRTIRSIRRGRMLQTDAAINPGNSGGPLIDLSGAVVGINTAIATRGVGYMGIGFAIPINQARWVADELANHGKVRRAALGLRLADLNKRIAESVDVPAGLGVLAYAVIANSAAEQAGIQQLDVITEFAGQRVRLASELQEAVERMPIGSTQAIKVVREGKELELQVLLAPFEDTTANAKPETANAKPETEGTEPEGDAETPAEKTPAPADGDQKPKTDKAPSGDTPQADGPSKQDGTDKG